MGSRALPAGLVEFVVRGLAGAADQVSVKTQETDNGLEISIRCHKEDMGRIIGKNGKTIGAIRHLASDAAARNQTRIKKLELVEP